MCKIPCVAHCIIWTILNTLDFANWKFIYFYFNRPFNSFGTLLISFSLKSTEQWVSEWAKDLPNIPINLSNEKLLLPTPDLITIININQLAWRGSVWEIIGKWIASKLGSLSTGAALSSSLSSSSLDSIMANDFFEFRLGLFTFRPNWLRPDRRLPYPDLKNITLCWWLR